MSRELTGKQQAALEVLRRHPDGAGAQQVADEIPDRTCGACGGTGDPQPADHEHMREYAARYPDHKIKPYATYCRRCAGHGTRRFGYPMAYTALQQLVKLGLADRRPLLDEWGDPVGGHIIYVPVDIEPDPDDPLEQAWELPAVEERVR